MVKFPWTQERVRNNRGIRAIEVYSVPEKIASITVICISFSLDGLITEKIASSSDPKSFGKKIRKYLHYILNGQYSLCL